MRLETGLEGGLESGQDLQDSRGHWTGLERTGLDWTGLEQRSDWLCPMYQDRERSAKDRKGHARQSWNPRARQGGQSKDRLRLSNRLEG